LNYLAGRAATPFLSSPTNAVATATMSGRSFRAMTSFHFDCSKLDQWQIVFDHAQQLGLYLHFKFRKPRTTTTATATAPTSRLHSTTATWASSANFTCANSSPIRPRTGVELESRRGKQPDCRTAARNGAIHPRQPIRIRITSSSTRSPTGKDGFTPTCLATSPC